MKYKKYLFISRLILLFSITSVCAIDTNDNIQTSDNDTQILEVKKNSKS